MARTVISAEFQHETNTFNHVPTGLAAFEALGILRGEQALAERGHANTALAGFQDIARTQGWTLLHSLSAQARPGGVVTRAAFEAITSEILTLARREAGQIDGVLLGLHGAMVLEDCDDGEGELLKRLRSVLGPDLPIAVTLDPHANVTQSMTDHAQILLSYKTYPHIDMREIGRQAASVLGRAMAGEIHPKTLRLACPMIEEANAGRTDIGPMVARIAQALSWEERADVFAVSINCGFGNADIRDLGPTVLVCHEGPAEPHHVFATEVLKDIWARRNDVLTTFLSVEQAAREARNHPAEARPLIIADYADNPGAGAPGDATALLAALLTSGGEGICFGPLVDPEAAELLQAAALGDEVTLAIGGKSTPLLGGGPLQITGILRRKGRGDYLGDGPMIGGIKGSWGDVAVLEIGGVTVLVTSQTGQIFDLQQFRAMGIDPEAHRVVALKSMQHFRAAFEPIADRVVLCDSGALCTPDFSHLPYRHARRPIFPLDREMIWP